MKFTLPIKLSNLRAGDQDFVRWVSQIFDQVFTIFNRNISFTDNCKTSLVSVAFASANTQQAVTHNLGKTPVGYIIVESQGTGVVYDGATSWTNQYMYLQCTAIETKKLLIF